MRQPGRRGQHHARPGAHAADAVARPASTRPPRELLAELRIPLQDTTRNVRSLSGGQRQLVAVARAMGRRPRLLALDEPTASLGVKESAQVEELIMGLREQGTTILLACHDIDQMFRLADRIVVLRQGRIVARPAPGRRAPRRRGRAAVRPAGRLLRPPPAHPAARADRPAGVRRPVLQPVADPVRARRGARHRAAVHSPGQPTDPVLRRVARVHARRARRRGPGCRSGPAGGPVGLAAADERPGHRRQRPGRRGLAQLPRPGQDGQGGQLVVGPGARARAG